LRDNVEVRRGLIDNGTPLALEIESGGGSDLPVAAKQPLVLECRQ
jgi:hypothetical protein